MPKSKLKQRSYGPYKLEKKNWLRSRKNVATKQYNVATKQKKCHDKAKMLMQRLKIVNVDMEKKCRDRASNKARLLMS